MGHEVIDVEIRAKWRILGLYLFLLGRLFWSLISRWSLKYLNFFILYPFLYDFSLYFPFMVSNRQLYMTHACIQKKNYTTQALDGLVLTGQELHDILNEIDLSYNGRLELADYFQVMKRESVQWDATIQRKSCSRWACVCVCNRANFIPHNHLISVQLNIVLEYICVY